MACKICKKQFTPSIDDGTYCPEGKPHLCFTCGKSFSLKIQLKRHMQTHEDGKPYICYACENQDDQSHTVSLSKKTNFACEICRKTFNTKRALLLHASEHNLVNCDTCNKSFKTVGEMEKHSAVHKKRGPSKKEKEESEKFQCDLCNAKFSALKTLDEHYLTDCKGKSSLDNDNAKKHVCSICNKMFSRKSALEGHVISHFADKTESAPEDDTDNDADFLCNFPGEKEKNDDPPKERCLPKLKIRKSYPCEECRKICATEKILEKHMLSHKKLAKVAANDVCLPKLKIRRYPCEICRRVWASKKFLEKHMLSHKEVIEVSINDEKMCLPKLKIRRYPCEVCNKMGFSEKTLEKHMLSHKKEIKESTNNEKRKYKCRICYDIFFSKIDYKNHKLTHNPKQESDNDMKKIKTYACKICFKVFSKKKHLKKHFMTHSSSTSTEDNTPENVIKINKKRVKRIKEFSCGTCGKLFAGEICLKKHELKHKDSDVKVQKVKKVRIPPSLICPFCDEDFSGRRFAFLRHKMAHTPEICGICDERFVDRAALREHLKTHIGTDEARKFLECSQKAQNFKTNLQNSEGKVEYIYLVLR